MKSNAVHLAKFRKRRMEVKHCVTYKLGMRPKTGSTICGYCQLRDVEEIYEKLFEETPPRRRLSPSISYVIPVTVSRNSAPSRASRLTFTPLLLICILIPQATNFFATQNRGCRRVNAHSSTNCAIIAN